MNDDLYIWNLISRSIFAEATPDEEEELRKLINEDLRLQQQYNILLQTLTENAQNPVETDNSAVKRIIGKATERAVVMKKISVNDFEAKKRPRTLFYWAAAAVFAIIVASSWYLSLRHQDKNALITGPLAIEAKNGSRNKMTLPDGSVVWLNAGSKLFYETDFTGKTREVQLVGEAFFDVVKMPGKPFIVHANNININVLGTAFNVKAYQNDKTVETSLFRGLVNITKNNDKNFQPILLRPNQKIVLPVTYSTEQTTVEVAGLPVQAQPIAIELLDSNAGANNHIETAWMNNRLEFRGDDFETLAAKLERWYNVRIVFLDNQVKSLHFNGSFEKETIEQALFALKTANSFNYKINNNEISISSNR